MGSVPVRPVQRDPQRVVPQVIPRPSDWQLGTEAPWAGDVLWKPTLADVVSVPTATDAKPIEFVADSRVSAVLVLLTDGEAGPEVVLTRRSLALRTHAGDVSFPGGRVDPGETAWDAALREAHEEVGLPVDAVTVHGELAHLFTFASRSYIVPVLATLDRPVELVPQTMEVDRVLPTSVADLVAPGTHHRERWMRPALRAEEPEFELHFFDLPTDIVWGATARILFDLLSRAYVERPA